MVTVSTLVAPDSSVTVSVTLYVPAVVKVCDGFAVGGRRRRRRSKSHAYVSAVPSGSLEPAEENCTSQRQRAGVRRRPTRAIGWRSPWT